MQRPPALLLCLLRAFATGLIFTLLADVSRSQDIDVWVHPDPTCGQNIPGNGTATNPWQSVDYALNGPHSPLPLCSRIHLYPSATAYSANTNNETFPWLLYNDVSLLAETSSHPGCPGTNVMVDGGGVFQWLIEYHPNQTFSCSIIRGLGLANAWVGIRMVPISGDHAPRIEGNTFQGVNTGIQVDAANGRVAPVIVGNDFQGPGVSGISVAGSVAGTSPNSAVMITGNTLTGYGNCSNCGSVDLASFTGLVECVSNTLEQNGLGIAVRGCNPWNASSRIEGNLCKNGGYGIRIDGTHDLTLPNNVCRGNQYGIAVDSSQHVTVRGNVCGPDQTTAGNGYGISVYDSSDALLTHNELLSNTQGGILVQGSGSASTRIVDNTICQNLGTGILDTSCDDTEICRNLIAQNSGYGIDLDQGSPPTLPSVRNNTIADNTFQGIHSVIMNPPTRYVVQNILWGNNGTGCELSGVGITHRECNDVEHCASPGVNGEISCNPQFVNPGACGYHLSTMPPASCAIDAGCPPNPPDCDGTPPDLGAYPTGSCAPTFCLGDGTGALCPCGNNGATGRACNNSANTGGAVLSGQGATSLSCDTLELTSAGERPTALSIFLQGSTQIAPVNFGDGLRCIGGILKRLYVKNASAGVVTAPSDSDPSVSARSAERGDLIPAGGSRYYQTYYRDPSPSFCPDPPGNTWNVSTALAVVWDP